MGVQIDKVAMGWGVLRDYSGKNWNDWPEYFEYGALTLGSVYGQCII